MANPFEPGYIPPPPSPSGGLTPGIIQALAGTKPWVRFCSVMGFIGSGFMVLGALTMMAEGVFAGASGQQGSAVTFGVNIGGGIVYLLIAGLYIIPSIKLWKFGTAILNLMVSQSGVHLDEAMELQRGFWKFVGIMMLIMLVIWGIMLVIMIGGMAASRAAIPSP